MLVKRGIAAWGWAGGVAHRQRAKANGRTTSLSSGNLVSFPNAVVAWSMSSQRAFTCRPRNAVRQQKQGASGACAQPAPVLQ